MCESTFSFLAEKEKWYGVCEGPGIIFQSIHYTDGSFCRVSETSVRDILVFGGL